MPETPSVSWIQTCSEKEFRALIRKSPPTEHASLFATRAEVDLTLFARQAIGAHLRLPFAGFHRALFEWHVEMGRAPLPDREGRRFALAAPRGNAKSTIVSLLLVLHDIAYARERYILLISATQRQAEQRLRAIKRELAPGGPLALWFPKRFARGSIIASTRALEAHGVRIEAFGAGAEMRGVTMQSWRPTKIVLDDAEASASAQSSKRRAKLLDWFGEVVEHLGDRYTHLLAIGTVLHPAGLLASLMARSDFESLRCRSIEQFAAPSPMWEEWRRTLTNVALAKRREEARRFYAAHRSEMNAGSVVLWPEKEDYERLMAQMILQGRRAFYQEKQNEPLGPEDALFEPDRAWRARRGEGGMVEILPPASDTTRMPIAAYATASLRLFGYHDAALGKGRASSAGDFAALATVARADDGRLILLSMWVRRASPSQQVEAVFDIHERQPFERLALEGTGFQELLTLPIEEERKRRRAQGGRDDLPLEIVLPRKAKAARIAALEPMIASGRLVLAEDLPEEFWLELSRYPKSEHDDALDAAAGAVELALTWTTRGAAKTEALPRAERRGPRSF